MNDITKHPDYIYAPFEYQLGQNLDHAEGAIKTFLGHCVRYAETKYGKNLGQVMTEKHARIEIRVLHLPDDQGGLLVAELTNQDWFEKEVIGKENK